MSKPQVTVRVLGAPQVHVTQARTLVELRDLLDLPLHGYPIVTVNGDEAEETLVLENDDCLVFSPASPDVLCARSDHTMTRLEHSLWQLYVSTASEMAWGDARLLDVQMSDLLCNHGILILRQPDGHVVWRAECDS